MIDQGTGLDFERSRCITEDKTSKLNLFARGVLERRIDLDVDAMVQEQSLGIPDYRMVHLTM